MGDSVSIGSPKPRRHSCSGLGQSSFEQSHGVQRGAEGPPPEWGLSVPWPWHAPTVFAVDTGGREAARGGGAARRWGAGRCEVDPVQLFRQLEAPGAALELAAAGGGGAGGDGMITRADFVSFGADLLQVCAMCMAWHVRSMWRSMCMAWDVRWWHVRGTKSVACTWYNCCRSNIYAYAAGLRGTGSLDTLRLPRDGGRTPQLQPLSQPQPQ